MDHGRYGGLPTHPEATLCQILQEAQHRWLRPPEVCEILRNYCKFKLTPDPPHKPQSGSLFLFDRKALRYFRKDGHNWRKKKDGKTVREAHERLKAGSVEVLHCYYAHGENNENFQRRSYWMLDTNEHIVLVHYREVKEGSRGGTRSPNSFSIVKSPSTGNSSSFVGNSRTISGTSPQTSPLVSPRSSSPNTSTDWNGPTYSPDCDGPESSDDTDQLRARESSDCHGMTRVVTNARIPQSSSSVVIGNQYSSNYKAKLFSPNNITARPGTEVDLLMSRVDNIQGAHVKQENGAVSPDGFDMQDWPEVLNKNNGCASTATGMVPGPTSYGLEGFPKGALNEGTGVICQNTVELRQLLPHPEAFPDVVNGDHCTWNTVVAPVDDGGQNASVMFSSFETDVPNELYQSHHQFPQKYQNMEQSNVDQQSLSKFDASSDNKDSSQSYVNVFRDFQADIPTQHIDHDAFKKYDSFGRWMNQDIGADIDTMLPFPSDITCWASALVEDDPALTQQMQVDTRSKSFSRHMCFSISDVSPTYASSNCDTKVLVVGSFSDTLENISESKWCCMFGDVEVPVEFLQPGVLRCIAPPHVPGKVPLCITRNDGIACSEVKEFEYRDESKESTVSSSERTSSYKRDILFQIRLARMLSCGITIPQRAIPEDISKDLSTALNSLSLFEEWEKMEDQLTDASFPARNLKVQFVDKLLKENFRLWVLKKVHDGGKGAAVLDDNGLGVLHMGAALGYTWIIVPILAAGVNINFRDSRGWTALHWAAHCGRESMVVALLANGAAPGAKTDPTSTFPAGQTPADLASTEHHKGIAGYLAEASLTSHLSLLTLKNKLDGSVLSIETIETVSEKSIIQPNAGESQEQLSLQDSLAAARNATQAAARIQSAFRVQSFKRKQVSYSHEKDEYGISNEEAKCIVAAQKSNRSGLTFQDDEVSHSAAICIQQKYRGWKGRREFLLFRQRVVKIQAHFRGHQVRKQYKKIVWSVSIVEKAILRWRRKGRGLRGFESVKLKALELGSNCDGDEDFLKAGRKQTEAGLEKALARVHSMVRSPEAREQYRRLLEGYEKTKVQMLGGPIVDANDVSKEEQSSEDFAMSTYSESFF